MNIEVVLALVVIGVFLALVGVAYLHGHKGGIESGIVRATTLPSGISQKLDAVVPGASTAAQGAADKVGAAVTSAVDKVS